MKAERAEIQPRTQIYPGFVSIGAHGDANQIWLAPRHDPFAQVSTARANTGGDGYRLREMCIRDRVMVPEHLSKAQDIVLQPGDRVRVRTPGGGGYGDPNLRDPALVAEDVRLGRYTATQAKSLFGWGA